MATLLNLPTFEVIGSEDFDSHVEVDVENRMKPNCCPHCGHSMLYSHDKKEQIFSDTPMQGKPVVLKILRLRYKCRSCNKTFREPLADIDEKRLMTSRLLKHIEKRALEDTFAVVSRETGLDEKTIRNVFNDYASEKAKSMKFETPRVLGIDELKLIKGYRCIYTNIEKNSVFDLQPTRNKPDVKKFLHNLDNPKRVEIVVMDMWRYYKEAVQEVLPWAEIVVDKFHIVKICSECLEKARKSIRKELERKDRIKLKNERFVLLKRRQSLTNEEVEKLQKWSGLFPDLGLAYDAKEAFFCLFDQGLDSATAKLALEDWQRGLSPQIAHYFEDLTSALRNWMPYILNGFDLPYTNAYTESTNRLIKDMQRMSRGYSFEVVRAKLLFNEKANKPTTTSIRKRRRKPVKEEPKTYLFSDNMFEKYGTTKQRYQTVIVEETLYYGPHIPTLCQMLEDGELD